MKLLTVLVTGFILLGGVAQATPSQWKVESEKKIYFAAEPVVRVHYDQVKADEKYWDRVIVSLAYEGEEMGAQAAKIRALNPGWEVVRLAVRGNGAYRLRIPSLGVDEEADLKPGVDGPYFTKEIYVSKKDSRRVREAAQDLDMFVSVEGGLSASIPREIVEERAELPSSVCRELFRGGTTVHSAVIGFLAVDALIQNAAAHEVTRAALRKQVLEGCIELDEWSRVKSFADVLALKLREKPPMDSFKAEYRVVRPQEVQFVLSYGVKAGE